MFSLRSGLLRGVLVRLECKTGQMSRAALESQTHTHKQVAFWFMVGATALHKQIDYMFQVLHTVKAWQQP